MSFAIPSEHKKILVVTIPKSGTHMLRKAIELLTDEPVYWIGLSYSRRFNPELDLQRDHAVTMGHIFPEIEAIHEKYGDDYVKVLLVRDLRDVMLSFMYHLKRGLTWSACPLFDYDRFAALPLQQQLVETLIFPKDYRNPAVCFSSAVAWMQDPSVFVCRFEDLVGSAGGGNDVVQRGVLTALAQHIGYPKSPEEIDEIANKLFGGTWTFRKGQIGSWREAYSDEALSVFNALYGEASLDLGYSIQEHVE